MSQVIREVWWQGVPNPGDTLADRIQDVIENYVNWNTPGILKSDSKLISIIPVPTATPSNQCVLLIFDS